jgi:transcription elongation factor GreA
VDDGTTEVYKIVTTVRSNSLAGLITNESPLGKALMRHKVGDVVHVQVNDTIGYDVKIIKIENTDGDDDQIRSF